MSATERRKGADAEREVVQILRDFGWANARRTSDGREQDQRGDIAGPKSFHLEVKRHERLNVPAAFDQVLADCPTNKLPILIHRPSRHEWMATMRLRDFLGLIK